MTDNPTTNTGTYDLLGERRQEGIVLSNTPATGTAATAYGTGTGIRADNQPRGPFSQAAAKSQQQQQQQTPQAKPQTVAPAGTNPASYDQQGFLAKFLINILLMLTSNLDADNKGNNTLIGMISKAFGMNENDDTEFRQLQTDVRTRGRETVRRERDYSRFDQGAASDAVRYNNQYSVAPVNEGTYQKFLAHLNHREGRRNTVYLDSEGKPTVGVGHLVRPEDNLRVGDRISDAQVAAFLEKDGRKAFQAARQQAAELGVKDESFIIALGSVNYQLGTGWREKFPSTWETMKRGDFNGAAAKIETSLWNKQTPVRVDDFQLALRTAERARDPSTSGTFASAASGAPKPPETNNPILVAQAPAADATPSRRQPSAPAGAIPT